MANDENENALEVRDVVKSLNIVPKLFYDKIVSFCRSNPSEATQAKLLFVTALDKQIDDLLVKQSYTEIFECFQDALNLFPNDSDVYNSLGVALNRLQKPVEALDYLRQAQQICPKKLKYWENRLNIINEWIPRWHFIMLNDVKRNEAFRNAIYEGIRIGNAKSVLDIGTGTGLLALYAHDAGAERLYACETNEVMLRMATGIFKKHGSNNIKLIENHSTNLTTNDLDQSKVDLIVTEIFDSGVFGEGVLSTLIHAKQHLLKEHGTIIPNCVKVYVVGVDHIGIAEIQESIESTLENSIYFKNTILIPKNDEPYDTYGANEEDDRLSVRTEAVQALTVDFNDLESMQKAEEGSLDSEIQLSCVEDGFLEGFLVFFTLHLNNDSITIRNFDPTFEKPITKCWDPVLFTLSRPMSVRKYQILKARVSCKGGVLSLKHDYDPPDKRLLSVDPELYAFLTDDEYLYELEYNVTKLLKKNKKKFLKFADFLTFPHIGINLLKEGKIECLFCLENMRSFIEEVADWNCIHRGSIKYIPDLDDLISSGVKFDLILLQPITAHGTINDEQLKYYEKLKCKCLSSHGAIFPSKMDLCAKLVYSPWLQSVTSVNNPELKSISIQKYMNEYSTRHQFEFKSFGSCDLSDVFTVSKVHFDEEYHERNVTVNLNLVRSQINGILYFFKIYFTNGSIPIATNRKKSCCTQNCFVQNYDVPEGKGNVVVRYTQDELVFRCEIVSNNNNNNNNNNNSS